jgi:alpha/beta superfamily hydrolase
MEAVTFTTGDGVRLEGELRMPDDPPRGSAVLCHPHPRHGGSKDHPLLWAIRNDLAGARGLAVLGFNFRGVMGSGGTYGGGRDEIQDVVAAIGEARARVDDEDLPTILVGWSFGASVALRAALDDPRVRAVALVGVPLEPQDLSLPPLPDATDLRGFRRPVLLLAGEHDTYAPAERVRAYADAFPDAEVRIVSGTDHYFWRREREAAQIVGTFADGVLTPA